MSNKLDQQHEIPPGYSFCSTKYIELTDGRKRQCNNFWSAFPAEDKQSYQGRSPHCMTQKGTTTTVFTTENVTP